MGGLCPIKFMRVLTPEQKRRHEINHREWLKRKGTERWKRRNLAKKHRYKVRHPIKYKARNAVAYAIQKGRLFALPCESCGAQDDIHAHHDDYSKPLDVRWLCRECHIAHHEKFPENGCS